MRALYIFAGIVSGFIVLGIVSLLLSQAKGANYAEHYAAVNAREKASCESYGLSEGTKEFSTCITCEVGWDLTESIAKMLCDSPKCTPLERGSCKPKPVDPVVSGAAKAAPDPGNCKTLLGHQPGTPEYDIAAASPEYAQCQRSPEAPGEEAKREGYDKGSSQPAKPTTNANLKVTLEPDEHLRGFYILVIVSYEDGITIRAVRINRGNCDPNISPQLPKTLKFGGQFKIGYFSRDFLPPLGCMPTETDVSTDRGDYRFPLSRAASDGHRGLEVTFGPEPSDPSSMTSVLVVTSYEDSVNIRAIRVNRGNCQPTVAPSLPVTLSFGESFVVRWFIQADCVPIEADISTDKGDYTFSHLK
jgi:hypothetical protein